MPGCVWCVCGLPQLKAESEAAERAALMAAVEAEIEALEAKKQQAQELAKKNRVGCGAHVWWS